MQRRTGAPGVTRRKRRKPEAAETEILDAAENFLRERPFRDMTVDDVMSATGLSRPSFYEYFRDRNHLIIRLTERLGDWTLQMAEPFLVNPDEPVRALETLAERVVEFYRERGHLLKAFVDAATQDARVEFARRGQLRRLADTVAGFIRAGMEKGSISGIDPDLVASALLLMDEAFLREELNRDEPDNHDRLVTTLATIWKRILYKL